MPDGVGTSFLLIALVATKSRRIKFRRVGELIEICFKIKPRFEGENEDIRFYIDQIKADITSCVLHGLFGSYMLYNIRFGSFKVQIPLLVSRFLVGLFLFLHFSCLSAP